MVETTAQETNYFHSMLYSSETACKISACSIICFCGGYAQDLAEYSIINNAHGGNADVQITRYYY